MMADCGIFDTEVIRSLTQAIVLFVVPVLTCIASTYDRLWIKFQGGSTHCLAVEPEASFI